MDAVGPAAPWVERARSTFLPQGTHWTHWFASTRLLTTWLEGRDLRENAPRLTDPSSAHTMWRALTRARMVAPLVDRLFSEHGSGPRVAEALESSTDLEPELRDVAIRLALARNE